MKSGNQKLKVKNFSFKLSDFDGMHRDRSCKGKFQLTFTTKKRFTIDALGPIAIPIIPLVTCHECRTSYEPPMFREFIETEIAKFLVTSKGMLSKKQIKFLRLFLDRTQEDFAKAIGVANKHDMSKIESENSERSLHADGQVRLKLYCARLLQIKDTEQLYAMADVEDSKVEIPSSIFPIKKEDLPFKAVG